MNKYYIEDLNKTATVALDLGFKNKTFLISGATGMIGRVLVDVLLKITSAHNIYVMGKSISECSDVFSSKEINYSSFDSLPDRNIDYVIHLASPTNSKFLKEKPVEVIEFIYESTKQLLEFSKERNSAFLFISSMEVYGEVYDEKKKNESDLGYLSLESTRSSYPESKRLCELLVRSFSNEYGLKCCSARLAQTFGAGTSIDDSRVFGYFARCVLNKQDIVLNTKGDTYGNYCYLADTIAALFYILAKGESGETYNVVGDNTRSTIYDMAKMVCNDIANGEISVNINLSNNSIFPNPTKLNMNNFKLKKLGWEPTYNLFEMFVRMIGND